MSAMDDDARLDAFRRYRQSRDRALRNELVEEHAGLAEALARRMSHRGESHDDLRQVALVGLLKAVERFDPDRGVRFTSFATPTILGELKRHFRDKGWAVRVPRRIQEVHLAVGKTVGELGQELGRSPTTAEIAERAGVLEEEVLESMEAGTLYRLASLDEPRGDADEAPSARVGEYDPGLENVENRLAVEKLLARLPEREQTIVQLRYFEGLTQSEIADRIGISQMHVSRLLAKSLERLGEHAANQRPGPQPQ
jgi:RNA polymerase sigma-B factor